MRFISYDNDIYLIKCILPVINFWMTCQFVFFVLATYIKTVSSFITLFGMCDYKSDMNHQLKSISVIWIVD